MQVRPPQLHLQRAMYTVSLEEGLWQAGRTIPGRPNFREDYYCQEENKFIGAVRLSHPYEL